MWYDYMRGKSSIHYTYYMHTHYIWLFPFTSDSSAWDSQVPQQGGGSVGAKRESPKIPTQTCRESCTSGQGQPQHHQGGVCDNDFPVTLRVHHSVFAAVDGGVLYCCRFFLISCCCRMCWPALTEPWLWSKTCLETLHAGRLVAIFFSLFYRCTDALLRG